MVVLELFQHSLPDTLDIQRFISQMALAAVNLRAQDRTGCSCL